MRATFPYGAAVPQPTSNPVTITYDDCRRVDRMIQPLSPRVNIIYDDGSSQVDQPIVVDNSERD